jgi:glycerol-3-phosphate O-acyltransferase
VSLVPLALFWRKGPRARRRFLNLSYGAATRPSDLAKVSSFLLTYKGLFVKVGDPIDLRFSIAQRRAEGEKAVARRVRRSILMFLYREEKVVEGPTLQSRHKVQDTVVNSPGVQAAIEGRARGRRSSIERSRAEAEQMFREIAANMNSTFLAILNFFVGAVMRRLFASIELSGIEKVAEYAKRYPLVLVPSHRSYFDFLIVSSLFYANHLVPPHIAARDNMAFGPFGFLWRRAGAFWASPRSSSSRAAARARARPWRRGWECSPGTSRPFSPAAAGTSSSSPSPSPTSAWWKRGRWWASWRAQRRPARA